MLDWCDYYRFFSDFELSFQTERANTIYLLDSSDNSLSYELILEPICRCENLHSDTSEREEIPVGCAHIQQAEHVKAMKEFIENNDYSEEMKALAKND